MNVSLPDRYVGPPELLGEGGFGRVYKLTDVERGVDVAVKVPHRSSPSLAREVWTELRAAASLRHPGFIQVLDAGVDPGGVPYLVMEYANAGSVQDWLNEGPPSWELAQQVVDEVLAALAYAHARGMVHRDVKPSNVLLSRDDSGRVSAKLTDFGLTKALARDGAYRSTRLGAGTLLYMAPETFEGDVAGVHPAADLYALGVLLYVLSSSRTPWKAEDLGLVVAKSQSTHRDLVPRPRLDLPSNLADIVDRLLDREPERRPALAADVRAELGGDCQVAVPVVTGMVVGPSVAMLREPLMVGRQAERATMWAVLVAEEPRVRGVVVRAKPGVGASRLCHWLCAALEESGEARPLHVRQHAGYSPTMAINAALRRRLGLGRLTGAELAKRARGWARATDGVDDEVERALLECLEPSRSPAHAVERVARQVALTERLLALEHQRPFSVIWWEQTEPDPRGIEFVSALKKQAWASGARLLILLDSDAACAVDEWSSLELGPLSDAEIAELLEDLSVPEASLRPLVARSEGIAWRAVEEARLLAGRESPMELPGNEGDGASTVGDDSTWVQTDTMEPATLGEARLQSFFVGPDRGFREDTVAVLSLLPSPCPAALVHAVLEDSDRVNRVLDDARRARLVVRDDDGTYLVAKGLGVPARSLTDRRRDAAALRLRCAEALLVSVDVPRGVALWTAARLLREAGEPERGLDALLEGVPEIMGVDPEAGMGLWSQATDLASSLKLGDARLARVRLGAARAARSLGDVDGATAQLDSIDLEAAPPEVRASVLELSATLKNLRADVSGGERQASEAVEAFAALGDVAGRARARLVQADAIARSGRREEAIPHLEEALADARVAASHHEELLAHLFLGRCLRGVGDTERAREELDRALELALSLKSATAEVSALRELGNIAMFRGEHEAADELFSRAVSRAELTGLKGEVAATRVSLGELARRRGDLSGARRQYGGALAVTRAHGLGGMSLTILVNLLITELASGRVRAAARRLAEADRILPPGKPHGLRPFVEAARVAIAAAQERFEDAEIALEELLEGEVPVDEDCGGLLEAAGLAAGRAGQALLAADAYGEALRIAEARSDTDAHARIKKAMSSLS